VSGVTKMGTWARTESANPPFQLVQFTTSAVNQAKKTLKISGIRCIPTPTKSCGPIEIPTPVMNISETYMWSTMPCDENTAPAACANPPTEGQDVVIPSTWEVTLDVSITACFRQIIVLGHLKWGHFSVNPHKNKTMHLSA